VKLSHDVTISEEHRQAMLMAIADLSLARPGWDYFLGEIADVLSGREMYQEFKRLHGDVIAASTNAYVLLLDRDELGAVLAAAGMTLANIAGESSYLDALQRVIERLAPAAAELKGAQQ
jgi:hypothetical protein